MTQLQKKSLLNYLSVKKKKKSNLKRKCHISFFFLNDLFIVGEATHDCGVNYAIEHHGQWVDGQ